MFTECTDPTCQSHGELVRLRRMRRELKALLDRWDGFSKGETLTTAAIRKIMVEADG